MVLREVTIPPAWQFLSIIIPCLGLSSLLRASPNQPNPLRFYRVGETLHRADVPHTLFRNADPHNPLRILTFHVAASGELDWAVASALAFLFLLAPGLIIL
jgi:hypothetical protein